MRSKRADKGEGFFFHFFFSQYKKYTEVERRKTIRRRMDGSGQRRLTGETTNRRVEV